MREYKRIIIKPGTLRTNAITVFKKRISSEWYRSSTGSVRTMPLSYRSLRLDSCSFIGWQFYEGCTSVFLRLSDKLSLKTRTLIMKMINFLLELLFHVFNKVSIIFAGIEISSRRRNWHYEIELKILMQLLTFYSWLRCDLLWSNPTRLNERRSKSRRLNSPRSWRKTTNSFENLVMVITDSYLNY